MMSLRWRERVCWAFVAFFALGCLVSSKIEDTAHRGTMQRFLHEEQQGYGSMEGEDDEEEESALKSTVVVCIVLLLIFLTIAFEVTEDYLEEIASRNMKPILEKLFGEMTVLGFLSIFTFCITQAGFFTKLSERLFEDPEELLEMFESVHYTIFFVMIFFCLQVLILVKAGGQTEEEWLEMDRLARNTDLRWTERAASFRQQRALRRMQSFGGLLGSSQQQKQHDELMFKAFRDEFLVDRDLDPPFAPSNEETLEDDFNFGRYLGVCLGQLLAHVVEVHISTWVMFAASTVVYYIFLLAVQENEVILAWTWTAAAWILFLFNMLFERHLIKLADAFAAKDSHYYRSTRGAVNESTELLGEEDVLPDWCHVDMDEYLESRAIWKRRLVGGVPNRQQALYWMDRKGPTFYLSILQINLLFVGLYCAMHVLEFGRVMYHTQLLGVFILYLFLAIVPILCIMGHKHRLMITLTPVCCVGTFRRPDSISHVIREEKTARAVRTFIIVYKLRRFAAQANLPTQKRKLQFHYSAYFDEFEIEEVGKTFDIFDSSGDGIISPGEFQQLMTKLGASLSQQELDQLVQTLDTDKSGGVSREEFLQWYAQHANEDHLSEQDFAKFMFQLFDTNGSGEITIGEFTKIFQSLNTGFSVDDVGALVHELDENNGGSIGLHEFQHLLHKYYPKELAANHHHSSRH